MAITSGSSSISSTSSSTTTSSSDFCVCANDAKPGATVLKNALVKNGEVFSLPLGSGLLTRGLLLLDGGVSVVSCGVAEDLTACGAADEDLVFLVFCGAGEDLVTCGAAEVLVEVDGSCLIGDSERGGGFVVISPSSWNAVL